MRLGLHISATYGGLNRRIPVTCIAVIGSVGAGKTTLTRRLSRAQDLHHCELDRVDWQPFRIAALGQHSHPLRVFHTRPPRQLEDVGQLLCAVEETTCSAS